MNNILNIKSPAENQALDLQSEFDLHNLGLGNLRKVYWNLPSEALYEEAIFRNEGKISHLGPLVVNSGKHTARSAQDKYIVHQATTEDKVWWGEYNRPISEDKFSELYSRMQGFLQGRDLFVQDCFVGADPEYRLPVRIVTELAWHSLFARNMFILPHTLEEYKYFVPEFTVLALPNFKAFPQIDGTRSETAIAINFVQNIGLIANSAYSGEIKKSIFTVMNYLMPNEGVMSMHCSANMNDNGETAIFFGLSGTGKTTLSADPSRWLIGDDEHGWSDRGVFNYEGGCYAKVIQLSSESEPQIFATTSRFGTILENVVYDLTTRNIDLDDDEFTENTRASYPLNFIENSVADKLGGHPNHLVFLTCDAQGVMPPIARLSPDQAMYHFISGYTSKVGGTEVGLGEEPEITFSACFGAPFMVHHPIVYAELLKNKMLRYDSVCWLVNTGWVGGPYGVGKRISIQHTRALLNAALDGKLNDIEYYTDPIFGFEVPKSCPGVPEGVLYPMSAWPNEEIYFNKYRQLASRFINNFRKYSPSSPQSVINAGPNISKRL